MATPIPAACVPITIDTKSASVNAITMTISTANFCRITLRRETGYASTMSRVPASSSPATARAPKPTAKTRMRIGPMNENSSVSIKPAGEEKSTDPPRKALRKAEGRFWRYWLRLPALFCTAGYTAQSNAT